VVTKRINVSEEAVAEAYRYSDRIYHIQYVLKDNEDLRRDCTVDEFDSLLAEGADSGKAGVMKQRWPFGPLYPYREYILTLPQGDISPPLKSFDGMMLVRIAAITTVDRKPFEEVAPIFRAVLEEFEGIRLRNEYEDSLHLAAQTKIDTAAVGTMICRLKNVTPDSTNINDIIDTHIASYVHNKTQEFITIREFIRYYNTLFMRRDLAYSAIAISYIKEMVFEIFACDDAAARGLNATEDFVNHMWNYKNMVMLGEYRKREIEPLITISDDECRKYYESTLSEFCDGEKVVVDILRFDSKDDAEHARILLIGGGEQDTSLISQQNIQYTTEKDVSISYDDADYSQNVRKHLFFINNGDVSNVFDIDNKYNIYIKKSESGTRQKSYPEAKQSIEELLFTNKKVHYSTAWLDSLKRDRIINRN
jgi:hypothetical protein